MPLPPWECAAPVRESEGQGGTVTVNADVAHRLPHSSRGRTVWEMLLYLPELGLWHVTL